MSWIRRLNSTMPRNAVVVVAVADLPCLNELKLLRQTDC